MAEVKHPQIPTVPGLTLDQIMAHPVFEGATDDEIAYSAQVSEHAVRAARWRTAERRATVSRGGRYE